MTTKRLLNLYTRLRDELAATGPNPRLLAVRSLQNQILRLYRAEQRYARLKAKTGVVLEFFERDRPLTAMDTKNLSAASAVNRGITEVLREWRAGASAARRGRLGATKRVR